MLTSRASSKRVDQKSILSRNSQKALSLIAGERQRGNITDAQAEALQRYLISMYFSEYLQATLEPFVEEFVERTQQRLKDEFGDLLKLISDLEQR